MEDAADLIGQPKMLDSCPCGWGARLVFGNQDDPSDGVVGDLYIRAPVSFSFHRGSLRHWCNALVIWC
jgi:hypothetical protein